MKVLNHPLIPQYSAKKEQNNFANTQSKPVIKTLSRDTVMFGFNPTEHATKIIKEYAKKGWYTMREETCRAIEIIGKEESIKILKENGAKQDRINSIMQSVENKAKIAEALKNGATTDDLIQQGLMIHWEGGTAG